MNILYKLLLEDNIENIKRIVSPKNIKDDLYELRLIDENQHANFQNTPNEECLNILLKNLLLGDSGGQKCKQFVEDIIQKNYDWFYKDLHVTIEDNEWIQNKYKGILNYGDFPRKPAHYVDRLDKIMQIQRCLRNLPTVGKVILYGMPGCGKTSLVMGVMTREMVLNIFAGKVFWITVGDADDEQLLMLLSKFYLKLSADTQENNNALFSSKDILKDKLKKKIRESNYNSQMLLVLDNVCSETVIEAFDIGCRVLITTQTKDIWKDDFDTQLIEIDGSFKLDETCALFAKCLNTPIDYIQNIQEVGEIHELCRGHPFSIALFGSQIAQFKEKLLDSGSRRKWKDFVKMLKKNCSNQRNALISSCIKTLDAKIQKRYSDLAIFPDDVNISSKVLEIMWELDEFQVGKIMKQLENKSLIVSYYNNDQHNYIFGIHVVLLSYLKNKYVDELKEKHERLISAYKKNCNDDFSRLTDDNYIYQYIGYHLKRAQSIKDFKIYFDLKFIGAKIKATGIGDILKDFNIYREEIEGQTITNSKNIVADIESFIRNFGHDLHKHEDISIIQCALQCNENSFIYQRGLEIANASTSSLYFNIQTPPKNDDCHVDEFQLPENCTFVCFGSSEDQLLIGTKEGVIELWDRTYRKLRYKFAGHTQSIRYIEVDPDGARFLSVSEDGLVKLWEFRGGAASKPALVQSHHINLFSEEQSIAPIGTFTPAENDHLASASFSNDYPSDQSIVLGSNKGTLYLRGKEKRELHLKKELPIEMLKFSRDNSLIIGVCGNELFVITKNLQQFIFEPITNPVIALRILDDDSFVTLCNGSVSLWRFTSRRMPKEKLPDIKENIIDTPMIDQQFSCDFLYNTQLYVFTTDNKVNVYDIVRAVKLESIPASGSENNDFVTAVDVYPSDNTTQIPFLLKYKNNVLKFYTTPKTLIQSKRKQKPIFDCYWAGTQTVRLANVASNNTIQISNKFVVLNDLDNLENTVTAVCFSQFGDSIAYGLKNGQVVEYEIKRNHKNYLWKFSSAVSQLKYFAKKPMLVASSKGGNLVVCYNGSAPSEITKQPPEPLAEIFYIDRCNSLLTVCKDRVINAWNPSNGTMENLRKRKYSDVTHTVQMCTMSRNGSFLALTMSNMFDLFLVDEEHGKVNLIDAGGAELEDDLFSCCFSSNNQYLAFGTRNGCIIVYQIISGNNTLHEYTRLYSHMSVVKCLLFSPHNANLLVSVGEQVVMWNLNKIPQDCLTRNRRSRRSRPCNTELSPQIENLTISHTMNQKIGSDAKPHLLRAIKLKGSYANAIFASPNFKTFVTKDDEGICYIMEMIE